MCRIHLVWRGFARWVAFAQLIEIFAEVVSSSSTPDDFNIAILPLRE
jgi:hypothetical protein